MWVPMTADSVRPSAVPGEKLLTGSRRTVSVAACRRRAGATIGARREGTTLVKLSPICEVGVTKTELIGCSPEELDCS